MHINVIKGCVLHHDYNNVKNFNLSCNENKKNYGSLELHWRNDNKYYKSIYNGEKSFYDNILDIIPTSVILFDLKDVNYGFHFNWLCQIPNTDLTLQLIGGHFITLPSGDEKYKK